MSEQKEIAEELYEAWINGKRKQVYETLHGFKKTKIIYVVARMVEMMPKDEADYFIHYALIAPEIR